jgi:hypothetical protein
MRGDPAFDAIRKGPEFIPLLDVADAGDERAREAFDHAATAAAACDIIG